MSYRDNVGRAFWIGLLLVGAALAGAVRLVPAGRAQEGAGAAAPARAAAVDMAKVFAESAEWHDARAEGERLRAARKRVLDPLREQVGMLERDIPNKTPGDELRKAQQELRVAANELQVTQMRQDAAIAAQFRTSYSGLLKKVDEAAAAYAREHGIDLVVRTQPSGESAGQGSLEDVHDRQVLYAAPRLDITDAIIRRLNTEYEAPIEVD